MPSLSRSASKPTQFNRSWLSRQDHIANVSKSSVQVRTTWSLVTGIVFDIVNVIDNAIYSMNLDLVVNYFKLIPKFEVKLLSDCLVRKGAPQSIASPFALEAPQESLARSMTSKVSLTRDLDSHDWLALGLAFLRAAQIGDLHWQCQPHLFPTRHTANVHCQWQCHWHCWPPSIQFCQPMDLLPRSICQHQALN